MKSDSIRKQLVEVKIFEDLKSELGRVPFSWEVKQRMRQDYPEEVSPLDIVLASFDKIFRGKRVVEI